MPSASPRRDGTHTHVDPVLHPRLKDWRRIATRFDRNIKNFIAAIALAAAVIWWL